MRYYKTEPAEQETTINILYKEQIIRIYSSRVETIEKLTKKIGEPDHRYKRSKTYWSGACWEIQFADIESGKRFPSSISLINFIINGEIDINKFISDIQKLGYVPKDRVKKDEK